MPVANPAIEAKYGPIVGLVASESEEPGKNREVRHNALTGSWSCQCSGYRFNRMCRHIAAVQESMGVPVTLAAGKKLVKMPKIKSSTGGAAPQRPSLDVRTEAQACARAIQRDTPQAVARIEEAIRKFMSQVPVAAVELPVAGFGVRMIVIDE